MYRNHRPTRQMLDGVILKACFRNWAQRSKVSVAPNPIRIALIRERIGFSISHCLIIIYTLWTYCISALYAALGIAPSAGFLANDPRATDKTALHLIAQQSPFNLLNTNLFKALSKRIRTVDVSFVRSIV